jgi:hypothetical protein
MDKDTNNTGLGFSSVLTLIFVVLKLVGVIDWSWWWVLSPILIDIGLTILICVGGIVYTIYAVKKGERDKWKF